MGRRIAREQKTVAAMIRLYCRDHHGGDAPCADCADLGRYAHARLQRCRFADDKPTCFHCPVHCYKPDLSARIRTVMRYAGPRMLRRHPLLAIGHLVDGWRDRRRKPLLPDVA